MSQMHHLDQIENLHYHFGDLRQESPATDSLLGKLWLDRAPIWKQVHGTAIHRVSSTRQNCGECDALWTSTAEQPVAVVTADCVPIILAHRSQALVASIHAGWRGTLAKICEKSVLSLLRESQTRADDWVAAIGPAIGVCCYEVGEDLIAQFKQTFPDVASQAIRGRQLDLKQINQAQLLKCGLTAIDLSKDCTFCNKDEHGQYRYHSFRREKKPCRQWSMAVKFCEQKSQ